MMTLINLELHLDFLVQMEEAVENAIARYESSDDADMIELYEMRKEVKAAKKVVQSQSVNGVPEDSPENNPVSHIHQEIPAKELVATSG